ncbi:PREDICTED: uncharacterized protein LOC108638455 [Capra hircus]|uniref:uncharacterized protein LOC108638455 n=1 Tax=Capra hircus TaxID=9925 RepID=UPI00084725DD|nr:PREDICTED: uncharacterized protein LOC108638455 [Capra hircus]
MALEAVTPRQREQRTLPDRTGQRGQRTAAASSSRVGYTQDPRPRLRGPWALSFAVLGVLLLVKPASAMSVRKDEIPQQSSAPLEGSLQQKLCLPGFYMEEASGGCAPCTDGTDYTNHSNTLPSCLPCMTCKSGGFLTTGPARKPSELLLEEKQKKITVPPPRTLSVSANLALSVEKMHLNSVKNAAPGTSRLVIRIVSGITIVLVGCVVWYFFNGREADRITPSPEMQQAGCLLEPAAPEGSQRRRWLLVPTDGTQSLKLFFSDFAAIFSL